MLSQIARCELEFLATMKTTVGPAILGLDWALRLEGLVQLEPGLAALDNGKYGRHLDIFLFSKNRILIP